LNHRDTESRRAEKATAKAKAKAKAKAVRIYRTDRIH
jgi:hypothetical protein